MKVARYILLIFLIIAGIAAIGIGMGLYHNSFMPLWVPLVAAVVPAVVTLPALVPRWRSLPGCGHVAVASLAHMALLGSVCFALFIGTNYAFASEPVPHEAVVESKFRREHTRYRRVGRGRMVPAGKYHTWHVALRLDDGRLTDTEVSLRKYNTIRRGARREVLLSRGLFGFTVVKNIKI